MNQLYYKKSLEIESKSVRSIYRQFFKLISIKIPLSDNDISHLNKALGVTRTPVITRVDSYEYKLLKNKICDPSNTYTEKQLFEHGKYAFFLNESAKKTIVKINTIISELVLLDKVKKDDFVYFYGYSPLEGLGDKNRDSKLIQDIKNKRGHRCQLCSISLPSSSSRLGFVEAHHIKHIGGDHNGPDTEENIILVCPNHHAVFHYSGLRINKADIDNFNGIGDIYIEYHNKNIATEDKFISKFLDIKLQH